MNISPACSPPTQPTDAIVGHPRYAAYQNYLAAMRRQLVTAMDFARWVAAMDKVENGWSTVFHVTDEKAFLDVGWYRHDFAPVTQKMSRVGPFATEAEAEAA